MFKELQTVVADSSAFTMCLAVYVQVHLPSQLAHFVQAFEPIFSLTRACWSGTTSSTSSSSTPRNPWLIPLSRFASGSFKRFVICGCFVCHAACVAAALTLLLQYPKSNRTSFCPWFPSSPCCARSVSHRPTALASFNRGTDARCCRRGRLPVLCCTCVGIC